MLNVPERIKSSSAQKVRLIFKDRDTGMKQRRGMESEDVAEDVVKIAGVTKETPKLTQLTYKGHLSLYTSLPNVNCFWGHYNLFPLRNTLLGKTKPC